MTIPVTPVAPAPSRDAAAQTGPGDARPGVLIVDDNRLIRESLSEMVAHMGYDAYAVANADALAWLDAPLRCRAARPAYAGRDGYALPRSRRAQAGRRQACR